MRRALTADNAMCIIRGMVTGEQIKAARLGLGESQASFAKRFGVYQTTVHRWETKGIPESGAAEELIRQFLEKLRAGVSQISKTTEAA